MSQTTLLGLIAAAVIGVSAVAGAVKAHEINKDANTTMETAEDEAIVAKLSEVSAKDLQMMIDTKPELVIVDSRRPSEYAKGHIPGAVAMTASETTEERLAALAPSKDIPMVFYCGNRQCPASGKTAKKAAEQGYVQLYKYTDGIEDWQAKGLPVVSD